MVKRRRNCSREEILARAFPPSFFADSPPAPHARCRIYCDLLFTRKIRDSGPTHTYPGTFESATFSFRIRLSSTRIRCNWKSNLQLFKSALQSGNYWIRYVSENVWTLNPDTFFYPLTSQDRAQFFTVNIQHGPRKEKFADSKISLYVWTGRQCSQLHKWDIPAVMITFALVQ